PFPTRRSSDLTRPVGEDDDGAVVLLEEPAGLVERLDRRGAVAPVDGDVAGGLPGGPEERDPGQLLLRDGAITRRDRRGDRPHVAPGHVVRRDALRPVRAHVLQARDAKGRTARAHHPGAPRAPGPVVDSAADAEQRADYHDRGKDDCNDNQDRVRPDGTDQRPPPAKWRYPSTSGGAMEPSPRRSAIPVSSRTTPTRVSAMP